MDESTLSNAQAEGVRLREALEDARHELATLHGLHAFDGAAPEESWRLDTSKVLAKIDEALGARPSGEEGRE
jgi:outer membrane protein TolC